MLKLNVIVIVLNQMITLSAFVKKYMFVVFITKDFVDTII